MRTEFLYILDRKKDMILSGGFNIFPKDIEEVIGTHPEVSDVTVTVYRIQSGGDTHCFGYPGTGCEP